LGRNFIFQANTPLLYSAFYYYPISSGRDTLIVLTSSSFLFSGRNSIFRANTPLLHSAFYYRPFFSGRNPLVILASRPPSRATSVLLLLVTNLSLWAAFYYGLALQLLLAAIAIPTVCIYPTSAKRLKQS
jgi:hypothetical protein